MNVVHRFLNGANPIIPGGTVLNPTLTLFLLQLVIIMATLRLLAFIGQFLSQPRVVFEIIGGI
jgi:hypothetical protein